MTVFVFLSGLNKDLNEVRGRILWKKPLPSLREVFSEVRRDDARRSIMMNLESPRARIEFDSFSLVTKGFDQEREKRNSKKGDRPWCDHYTKPWHTCDTH